MPSRDLVSCSRCLTTVPRQMDGYARTTPLTFGATASRSSTMTSMFSPPSQELLSVHSSMTRRLRHACRRSLGAHRQRQSFKAEFLIHMYRLGKFVQWRHAAPVWVCAGVSGSGSAGPSLRRTGCPPSGCTRRRQRLVSAVVVLRHATLICRPGTASAPVVCVTGQHSLCANEWVSHHRPRAGRQCCPRDRRRSLSAGVPREEDVMLCSNPIIAATRCLPRYGEAFEVSRLEGVVA